MSENVTKEGKSIHLEVVERLKDDLEIGYCTSMKYGVQTFYLTTVDTSVEAQFQCSMLRHMLKNMGMKVTGTIYAPFTDDEVEKLKAWQSGEKTFPMQVGDQMIQVPPHPFTCCSPNIEGCTKKTGESDGVLIPSLEGFTCPCGKYKQNWCHDYMVE